MLAEIALKDILLMLSKRNQEKRIYQKGKQKGILQNVEVMEEIQQLDNKDYMDELNLYKDVLYKNSCNNFKIIMWKKIPYVVPIATQTLVALRFHILGSIRELLRLGHVEDVFIILRTSFEGYIASRYIDEEYNTDILNDFIFIPQLIAARKIIYQNGKAVERGTQEIIEYIQRNPSDMKLGRDKRYFYDFYAFLCNYAHCNFSIINEFIDDGQFSCDKSDNIYMAKVMTLFVYIKLFESIVTVEGEDFLNSREEKECYKLVRESTKFIYDRLEEFSKYNCKTASDELNRHMRNMFKNMRSSLKEEVGSIKKDFL